MRLPVSPSAVGDGCFRTSSKESHMTFTTSLPPGPEGVPYFGNALQFVRDPLGFVQGTQRSFGALATVYLFRHPVIMCFRPEHVRSFLVEHPLRFTSREVTMNLRRLLGDGLLTID